MAIKVTFEIIGETLGDIAQQVLEISKGLEVVNPDAEVVPFKQPEPEGEVEVEKAPEPKKTRAKAKPEPKPEPEPVEEAEEEAPGGEAAPEETGATPEEDWTTACNMLMDHWQQGEDEKAAVRAVIESYGVKQFREIPKEKGSDLLAKAKELIG